MNYRGESMANNIRERDFYFGAILSVLLKGKYTPSLISADKDTGRIYEFAVNNEPDFILLMKHSAKPRQDTEDKDYNSWAFTFNEEELDKIKDCIDKNEKIKIAYLCGMEDLYQSELALMDNKDIMETVYMDGVLRKSITIRRDKGKHNYSVFRGKGSHNPYSLKAQLSDT